MNFTEFEENEIEKLAERLKLKVHIMAGRVSVSTPRGMWHLVPDYTNSANGVKLEHGNSIKRKGKHHFMQEYHDQRRAFSSILNALEYIKCHDAVCIPR